MIVRITSIFIVVSLLITLIALAINAMFRSLSVPDELNCSGNVDIRVMHADSEALSGDIQVTAHIVPFAKKRSYVSEYGYVVAEGKKYIIDRNVRLLFSETKTNGFSEVHREGTDKNPADTLPDAVAKMLISSQSIFFYKLDKLQDDIWRWSDLRRTILICKVVA
ncbi:hypothetical protein [Pseudocitrobacter cyperus]|uniref:FidL-like membrane protein n=1 Tax=Pseudocitrobacter cyperus TaxID=3112843 RepID=A0ABV0HPF3_9ENTR